MRSKLIISASVLALLALAGCKDEQASTSTDGITPNASETTSSTGNAVDSTIDSATNDANQGIDRFEDEANNATGDRLNTDQMNSAADAAKGEVDDRLNTLKNSIDRTTSSSTTPN